MKYWARKFFVITVSIAVSGVVLAGLGGCPSKNSTPVASDPSTQTPVTSAHLPPTMVTSTVDSGLTATIGAPNGSFSKPDGNPTMVSTVPASAGSATGQPDQGYQRTEQSEPSIIYSGKWKTDVSAEKYSSGSAVYSSTAGAQLRFTFSGTAARWIGYRDTHSGLADVYLDGKLVTTVDTYSSVPKSQVVIYSAAGLSPGSHTLALQVDGRQDANATGSNVWVDAIDVQGSSTSAVSKPDPRAASPAANGGDTRIQQDNADVNYSGTWETHGSSLLVNYSGGTAAESDTAGARATLTFVGTAVSWVGYRDTLSGIADVYLDGAPVATVDTYSTIPQSQVVLYSVSGLSPSSHTLTIQAAGRHSLLSLGSAVWVDAFDVQEIPQDTTPPSVSITSPASGATVSGTITVSADASDNVGVAGVQFELDGKELGDEDAAAPYTVSWDTSSVANGSHTLTAVARDAAGNRTTSSPVTVTVSNSTQPPPDTTPPTVTMTAPANGATVSGTVTVSANASDNVGVTNVEFELDGAALANDNSAPYSIAWDSTTVANGTHTLTAIASDAAGNTTTASPITVTVSNTTQPPPDTTPPTVTMTAPSNGATVSNTVTVSANASDNVGVAGVQFELDGAALGAEDTTAPYAISWDTTSVANGSHTLTAIAYDAAGNQTTASPVNVNVSNSTGGGGGGGGSTTRIEQDNPAIVYTGTWVTGSDSSVSGGTATETNQANATATLTFNGTGVSWISYRCTCTAGISNVSLDGGAPTQVDTYAPQAEPQAVVYSVSNLKKGQHTLKITVTGKYDKNGQTAYVVVDAFDITN